MNSAKKAACFGASVVASVVVPPAARAQCPFTFAPAVDHTVTVAASFATGDLNGDGKVDLVMGGVHGGTGSDVHCTIMLGRGDGAFDPAVQIRFGTSASTAYAGVALGDFNADGAPDIAVTTGSLNSLSILLNNGDGTFGTPTSIPFTTPLSQLVVGDFNGDGRPDILVSGFSGTLHIVYGTGATPGGGAGFTTPAQVPLPAGRLSAGDVNNDGRLDIITSNPSAGTMLVYYGTGVAGPGAFTAGPSYPTPSPAGQLLADVDGDGKLDVLTARTTGSTITLFRGSGTGTFTNAGPINTFESPVYMAATDANGDGIVDLVMVGTSGLTVLRGLGGGAFAAPSLIDSGLITVSLAVADLDGNGSPDVMMGGYLQPPTLNQRLRVLSNTGAGFTRPTITRQPMSQVVAPGASTLLTSAATGFGPALSYRWYRNGVALTDGGNISGATSTSLRINPAAGSDVAFYEMEASCDSSCATGVTVSTRSGRAVVGVTGVTPSAVCVADLGAAGGLPGHDGFLDNNDFIAFINAFFNHTGCP
ncbi:MAG: FG-GAP-like repeat-containing protein [Phycisphaerales bacterium]